MISIGDAASDVVDQAALCWERHRDFLLERCTSPIERKFACAVMRRGFMAARLFPELCVDVGKFVTTASRHPLRLICAAQVGIEPFTVDFLFGRDEFKTHTMVAVECDGHEFHEKTKEQAARDKARDRKIMASDIRVFRFTGSEIWKDADGCVEEIMGHF